MVEDGPQPRLALPNRVLRQLPLGDVEDQHAEAGHLSRGVEVGNVVRIHPARSRGVLNLGLKVDLLATQGPVDVFAGELHRLRSEHVVDLLAHHLVGRTSEPGAVEPVDEAVPAIAAHIGDEGGHDVGDVAQLLLALPQHRMAPFELGARGDHLAQPHAEKNNRGNGGQRHRGRGGCVRERLSQSRHSRLK